MNAQLNAGDGSLRNTGAAAKPAEATEFRNFIADVEDLVKATGSLTGDDLARAKAKLNARIASAKHSVEEMGEAAVGRVRYAAKVTDSYVHDNPWKAVGAGAALGLLVGFLIARR